MAFLLPPCLEKSHGWSALPEERNFAVASLSALLVAKLHKIGERGQSADRLEDKDALDVLRVLRAVPTADVANGLERLASVDVSLR